MAPIGKIYSYHGGPRVHSIQIIAKYNGLEIELPPFEMGVDHKAENFLKKFPLGKVPTFEGVDGTLLFESGAIAYYVANYKDDTTLLGRNKTEAALIHQWMSFLDNELMPHLMVWVMPLRGRVPFNKAQHENAITNLKRALGALNKSLLTRTYLVGESITLADILIGSFLSTAFRDLFDKPFRDEFKNVTRWFITCVNQPNFKAIIGEIPLCEVQAKYVAPKKEKDEKKKDEKPKEEKSKEEKPKKEKKKKTEEEDEEDDGIPREEPKPKSKLELLPPSKLALDDWKRFYSNNETKPTAVNWFWEHFDSEGYSIWRVDYKYNDELTLTWQSNNLLGGFMNRLERARKYAFGSMVVRGVNNNNNISGYFFIRGQEVPEEVTDAADYDSFNFTKIEPADYPSKKSEIDDYLAWDMPGFVDGKIFK